MRFSAVFISLSLGLAATSSPVVIKSSPITFPIVRRINAIGGTKAIVERDRARAAAMVARAKAIRSNGAVQLPQRRAVVNEAVINEAVTYIAEVGVGTPPTTYQLLVDTGSSNTWVGAGAPYVPTSSSVQTSDTVSVTYGSGSFSGNEFIDTVTITPNLVIVNQSIGVATTSSGFSGVDGILGIGPVDLTENTLSPSGALVPTVTDNAFSQGLITQNLVAVSFNPTTSVEITNGELTWGGTDSTKFTGTITSIPKTTTFPADFYWGINQSVAYGSSRTNILSTTAGIVDTGTTLVLLASDAFSRYRTATGAVNDAATGLLRLSTSQFANLQSLFLTAGGRTFEFTANAQAWPRALNTAIGGTTTRVYLIVANLGTPSGEGFDFVNGYTFLERYYSVFDTTTGTVGFATTSNTAATTN